MRAFLTRLVYLGVSGVRGLRASPVTSAVASLTIAMCLVLLGAFLLLLWNMEELLDDFGSDLYVTAYLDPAVSEAARRELIEVVATVEGVHEVRLVTEAEALERFSEGVGRGSALLSGLTENPLPASLEIALVPGQQSAAGMRIVQESLDGLPGISDLSSGHEWVEGYLRAVALLRGIGIGLAVILALATLLIISNTIRLAVLARRDEIEILALVGASRGFIQTPFLFEGCLQGLVGGGLALVLLYGLFRLVLPGFEFGLEFVLGGAAPRFFAFGEAMVVLSVGAGLGLFGSAAAVAGGWKA